VVPHVLPVYQTPVSKFVGKNVHKVMTSAPFWLECCARDFDSQTFDCQFFLPAHRPEKMPMINGVLNAEMATLMRDCSVCQEFKDFLCKFNICTMDCFVWGARNASDRVDVDLIDAAAIPDVTITQKIAIRKAWWLASIDIAKRTEAKKAPPSAETNMPISRDDAITLHGLFMKRHEIRLGSVRLLSDQIQGRLLREYGAIPKTFQALLPEKLVFRDSLVAPVGTQLNWWNGEAPSKTEIFIESISDTIDLWTRIRALCNTLSFISIQDPDWFPFGESDAFADKLLVWMNKKYNGKRPALQYFIQAYISTFSHFCEEMRDNNTSMSVLVKNESFYRSFWTNPEGVASSSQMALPPVMSPPPLPKSGNGSQPDISSDMGRELARMRSMNDKLHARLDKQSNNGNRNGNFGGKGGGKGGGFGKGGGDNRNDRGEKRKFDDRRANLKGNGERRTGTDDRDGAAHKRR